MPQLFRQLILYPDDPLWVSTSCEDVCRDVGLIAGHIDEQISQRFYIGTLFLQHINFMGCAPAIEFAPIEDAPLDWAEFIFVELSLRPSEDHCCVDFEMARPQCPQCNKRMGQPQLYLSEDARQLTCPHCQHKAQLAVFNWREFGACARTMVRLVNVYPKEAIPTENLLLQLEKQTQIKWHYFYFNGALS